VTENWQIDPVHCLTRDDPRRQPCPVLTSRNEARKMPTTVQFGTSAEKGDTWSVGRFTVRRPAFPRTGRLMDIYKLFVKPDAGGNRDLTGPELVELSDVLRAAQTGGGKFSCAGMSIQDMVWQELDSVMDRLMTDTAAADGRDPGRAEGFAMALAIFLNPYRPNIEAIREEAVTRWERNNDEG
jgi:hypothetical protein